MAQNYRDIDKISLNIFVAGMSRCQNELDCRSGFLTFHSPYATEHKSKITTVGEKLGYTSLAAIASAPSGKNPWVTDSVSVRRTKLHRLGEVVLSPHLSS